MAVGFFQPAPGKEQRVWLVHTQLKWLASALNGSCVVPGRHRPARQCNLGLPLRLQHGNNCDWCKPPQRFDALMRLSQPRPYA